jgi:hypothetical protein
VNETPRPPTVHGRVTPLRRPAASEEVSPWNNNASQPAEAQLHASRPAPQAPEPARDAEVLAFPVARSKPKLWPRLDQSLRGYMAVRGLSQESQAFVCTVMRGFWDALETEWFPNSEDEAEEEIDDEPLSVHADRIVGLTLAHINELKAKLFTERFGREIEFQFVIEQGDGRYGA